MNGDPHGGGIDPERGRKNIRLAIILGLVALGIYVAYFVIYAT